MAVLAHQNWEGGAMLKPAAASRLLLMNDQLSIIMVTHYFVARQTGGAKPKSGAQLHPLRLPIEPPLPRHHQFSFLMLCWLHVRPPLLPAKRYSDHVFVCWLGLVGLFVCLFIRLFVRYACCDFSKSSLQVGFREIRRRCSTSQSKTMLPFERSRSKFKVKTAVLEYL